MLEEYAVNITKAIQLSGLKRETTATISNCDIGDALIKSKHLTKLILMGAQFSNVLDGKNLPNLQTLIIDTCKITGVLIITNFSKLLDLTIVKNEISNTDIRVDMCPALINWTCEQSVRVLRLDKLGANSSLKKFTCQSPPKRLNGVSWLVVPNAMLAEVDFCLLKPFDTIESQTRVVSANEMLDTTETEFLQYIQFWDKVKE